MTERTRIMMLGNLGLGPDWRTTFMNPPTTTPQYPQNLLRQTVMNGLGTLGRIAVSPSMVRMVPGPGPMEVRPVGQLPYRRGRRWSPARMLGGTYLGQPEETVQVQEPVSQVVPEPVLQDAADPLAMDVAPAPLQPTQASLSVTPNGNGFRVNTGFGVSWALISGVSGLASLWHGYRRNNALGWGLMWGAMGVLFPVVTPVVGLAQGWGKRKGRR